MTTSHHTSHYVIYNADAFEWLRTRLANSYHGRWRGWRCRGFRSAAKQPRCGCYLRQRRISPNPPRASSDSVAGSGMVAT
jgi:hypothetical protein